MKNRVYTWRLSESLRSDLERAARVRKLRVSTVLDMAVREWLAKNAQDVAGDEEQRRLHTAAAKWLGSIRGDDPFRSQNASKLVRQQLLRRHGRKLSD